MRITRCAYCLLPTSCHFAHCQESGIKGQMPPEALRPGAIRFEPGELRQPRLSEWLAKQGKVGK